VPGGSIGLWLSGEEELALERLAGIEVDDRVVVVPVVQPGGQEGAGDLRDALRHDLLPREVTP
jgi:hypothetical protein